MVTSVIVLSMVADVLRCDACDVPNPDVSCAERRTQETTEAARISDALSNIIS